MELGTIMWRETTDPKDPISKEGEYTWDHPWLEGVACYTVTKHQDGTWLARWWHGNRGHFVSREADLDSAMNACRQHAIRMFLKFSECIFKG